MFLHRWDDLCECGVRYADHSALNDYCPSAPDPTGFIQWFQDGRGGRGRRTFIPADRTKDRAGVSMDYDALIAFLDATEAAVARLAPLVARYGSPEDLAVLGALEDHYRGLVR